MALPPQKTADTASGRISYREAGSGPALMLMHGLGGNARTWERQLDALSASRRVIAWDAPGYGGSDDLAPDVETYARAGLALMDALGVRTAALCGHSMGGVIATRLAALAPERIERLVLSCSLLGDGRPAGGPLADGYAARIADFETMSPAEFGQARAVSMTSPKTSPEIRAHVAAIIGELRPEGFAAGCRLLNDADNAAAAAGLRMPVLVISAADDVVVTAARVDALAACIAGHRRVVIPDAGHAPYLEAAQTYNDVLMGFLA
jgi:pimeloyl-ACP methyl ester carboxylesterase